jgi:hypothetical protein
MKLQIKNLVSLQHKNILKVLISLYLLFSWPLPGHALQPDEVFQKASPSIVLILARNPDKDTESQGSGVVIASEQVITNCHILKRMKTITIKWQQSEYEASLEFPDIKRDLCQLKVPRLEAPAAKLGKLEYVRTGQRVYAIGNPAGLELSLSDGLVSSIRTEKGDKQIQTTATVTHGSSGGGLFDEEARLIGIIQKGIVHGALGLNFAIPSDYIAEVPSRGRETLAGRPPESIPERKPQVTRKKPKPNSRYPRTLRGEEIVAHFQKYRQLKFDMAPLADFTITILPNGLVERYCPICTMTTGSGNITFKLSQNLACFDWDMVSYPSSTCFQLIQIEKNRYKLVDPIDGETYSYIVP